MDIGTIQLQRVATLSGVVHDSHGRPVPGAVVRRGSPTGYSGYYQFGPIDQPSGLTLPRDVDHYDPRFAGPEGAVCDADGRFRIASLPPGRLIISAEHPDYRHTIRPFDLSDGEVHGPIELVLHPRLEAEVTVTDEHGAPIAGAQVAALETAAGFDPYRRAPLYSWKALSDAGGYARISGIMIERVDIEVVVPGRVTFRREVVLRNDQPNRVAVVLPVGGALIGRAVLEDGTPVRQANLWVAPCTADGSRTDGIEVSPYEPIVTADDGRFRVEGLPAGLYRLEIAGGFTPVPGGGSTIRRVLAPLTVQAGQPTDCGDLVFPLSAEVRIRVLDGNGKPMAGVEVRGHSAERFIFTDASGLAVLPADGNHDSTRALPLHYRVPGTGQSVGMLVPLTAWPVGEPLELTVTFTWVTLRLRAVDRAGNPMKAGMAVFPTHGGMVSSIWSRQSMADGAYQDVLLAPGRYRLSLSADEWSYDQVIELQAGVDRTIDLQPSPLMDLRLKIARYDGLPAVGCRYRVGQLRMDGAYPDEVYSSEWTPMLAEGTTDADGCASLQLPAEAWGRSQWPERIGVEVRTGPGEPPAVFELLPTDGEAELSLTLPPPVAAHRAAINGVVRDADGNPQAGCRLVIKWAAPGSRLLTCHEMQSDVDGRFQLDTLPAGDWAIIAHPEGSTEPVIVNVVAQDDRVAECGVRLPRE